MAELSELDTGTTLKLSSTGDIELAGRSFDMVSGSDKLIQDLYTRLKTMMGSYLFDIKYGINILDIVESKYNTSMIQGMITSALTSYPYVDKVTAVNVYKNVAAKGQISVVIKATLTNGQRVSISSDVGGSSGSGVSPVAGFTTNPDPVIGVVPLTVSFTDTSMPGIPVTTTYLWDFGDGQTSSLKNPGTHHYTTGGKYLIRQRVSNATGTGSTSVNVYAWEAVKEIEISGNDVIQLDTLYTYSASPSVGYGQSYTYEWSVVTEDDDSYTIHNGTDESTLNISFHDDVTYTITCKIVAYDHNDNELSPKWSPRLGHTTVLFDDKLWTLGGNGTDGILNDVWYSTDGHAWTELPNTFWDERFAHSSVVFDNKLWILGGYDVVDPLGDIWYTSDGVIWTEVSPSEMWSARYGHTSLIFDGKLWVIGGQNGTNEFNDVWYTTNGVTWTEATSEAEWSSRSFHSSVVFNGKMWVIGGLNRQDVWCSSDGVTWTEVTSTNEWGPRFAHTTVLFDNMIWLIGGAGISGYFNDAWYSFDGKYWSKAKIQDDWNTYAYATSLVFNNMLWTFGGTNDTGKTNDVWYYGGM